MTYKMIKLDEPIYRSNRRKFTYSILRLEDGEWYTLFLFEDEESAKYTLEKLGA